LLWLASQAGQLTSTNSPHLDNSLPTSVNATIRCLAINSTGRMAFSVNSLTGFLNFQQSIIKGGGLF
jgi:uncharacterized protein YfdQ (DUF2303 family)